MSGKQVKQAIDRASIDRQDRNMNIFNQGETAIRTEPRRPTMEGLWRLHGKDKKIDIQTGLECNKSFIQQTPFMEVPQPEKINFYNTPLSITQGKAPTGIGPI
jgi:hypothetical protein